MTDQSPPDHPRVVAIIQARMGSTRLPGKVLEPILDRPMLAHQIDRVRGSEFLDELVVATSTDDADDPIETFCGQREIACFRGSEEDVLDRMYKAAEANEADIIVRLTGDCPLLTPATVDRFVGHFLDRRPEVDYVGGDATLPEGFDVEVMTFDALETAWRKAKNAYEREHVTVYIWQSGEFSTERLPHETDLSSVRLTVDEPADLAVVREIFQELYPEHGHGFGLEKILGLLGSRPELAEANQDITRNEGFLASLNEERVDRVERREGDLDASADLQARADGLIPAGTQTLSKGPTQFVQGVAPAYLERGQGARVWDVDGNEYLDYMMGLGAVILGHSHPVVNRAIQEQLENGTAFTLPHRLEVEVSELIRDLVPCAEMVRFGKNGSDVTTAAIRVARAHTGRERVVHCGYHGWHDWYIGSKSRNKGVPKWAIDQQAAFDYNDLTSLQETLKSQRNETAAIIMEPYGATLPEDGFLEGVRDLAQDHGAVLIFDEVATGFRFEVGGIHQRFGVEPDLACFGKAIANGLPLSVLTGRSEVMAELDEVFFSGTFGGECLSLAAAQATIGEIQTGEVLPHIDQMGTRLKEGINRLAWDLGIHDVVECIGLPARTFMTFDERAFASTLELKSLFQQEAVKRKILFTGTHMPTASHTEDDIEYTLGAYQQVFELFAEALEAKDIRDRLEGPPLRPVFRDVT